MTLPCLLCGGTIHETDRAEFGPVTLTALECDGCGWEGRMTQETLDGGVTAVDVETEPADA